MVTKSLSEIRPRHANILDIQILPETLGMGSVIMSQYKISSMISKFDYNSIQHSKTVHGLEHHAKAALYSKLYSGQLNNVNTCGTSRPCNCFTPDQISSTRHKGVPGSRQVTWLPAFLGADDNSLTSVISQVRSSTTRGGSSRGKNNARFWKSPSSRFKIQKHLLKNVQAPIIQINRTI